MFLELPTSVEAKNASIGSEAPARKRPGAVPGRAKGRVGPHKAKYLSLTDGLQTGTLPAVSDSRRRFLIWGVSGVAGATVATGTYAWLRQSGYEIDPPRSVGRGQARLKTAGLETPPYDSRAQAILEWLLEALLPGDPAHRLPGALSVGVLDYVMAASALPGLVPVRNDILKLTRHLDQRMQRTRQTRFTDAAEADRAQILQEAARDTEARGRFIPARAVEATLRLALEGYLGHPFHGGNRNTAVWNALRIEMPRFRNPSPHPRAP